MWRMFSVWKQSVGCLVCAAVAVLAVTGPAPASAQLQIDTTITPSEPHDLRFSWIHWWETQRPMYQQWRVSQATPNLADVRSAVVEPHRDQIVETLMPLVSEVGTDPYVRAGATLALARMGHELLVDKIVSNDAPADDQPQRVGPDGQAWPVGLIGDESPRVRVAGWLSLALLNTSKSRAYLIDDFVWAVSEFDQIARVTALGLLPDLTQKERDFLLSTMRHSDSAEVQRMGLWTLRQHDSPDNDEIMTQAVYQLRSPYSVSEALLASNSMQRGRQHQMMISMIARQPQLEEEVRFLAMLKAKDWWPAPRTSSKRISRELMVAAALSLTHIPPASGSDLRDSRRQLTQTMFRGTKRLTPAEVEREMDVPIIDFQRGPAALALAMQTDADTRLNTDIVNLLRLLDGQTDAAVIIDEDYRRAHDELELPEREEQRQRFNNARGYAAVALGLMIQRMTPDTLAGESRPLNVSNRRTQYVGQMSRKLIQGLENNREPLDFRCACAIALGLSGDASFREPLREELGELGPEELVLYGYITEALGLLGDPIVSQLAGQYLGQATGLISEADLLGRRATISGLVMQGGPDAQALLIGTWAHDPWVGFDAARAAAALGGGDMIVYLLDALDDEQLAAPAAASLAELVDTQTPWRLSSLTADMNYTIDFRMPVDTGCGYNPAIDTGMPTRIVLGMDNPYLMHGLLMRQIPAGGTPDNDDSDGPGQFIFPVVIRSELSAAE